MGTIDYVTGSIRQGYGLTKRSAQPLFIDLIKVAILTSAISLVGLMIAGGLVYLAIGGEIISLMSGLMTAGDTASMPSVNWGATGLAIFAAIIVMLIFGIISKAAGSVVYNVVENRGLGKGTPITDMFLKNLMPVVRMQVVIWVVILVAMVPLMGSMMLGSGMAFAAICIVIPLTLLALLAFLFFVQFSMLELILKGTGAIEALKSSGRLVRANLLTTLLLDIVLVIIAMASGAVLQVIRAILQIIPAAFNFGGFDGMLLGLAVFIVLFGIISLVIQTAVQTITLPIVYYFWKGLRG